MLQSGGYTRYTGALSDPQLSQEGKPLVRWVFPAWFTQFGCLGKEEGERRKSGELA